MIRFSSSLILAFLLAAFSTTEAADEATPLKVFILAGQSNMQGHAQVSTFEAMRLRPHLAPLLDEMTNDDGTPVICNDVWISSLGSSEEVRTGPLTAGFGAGGRGPKIGPEFTFGITMHELLGEPLLIIKTAWGGKSLHTDFRPPSAGPYEFNETQLQRFQQQGKDIEQIRREKTNATGHFYRLMIEHVHAVLADIESVVSEYDEEQGYELAGFVWFQGWNDMVDSGTYPDRGQPGGYDQYSKLMAQFIRDVRMDLSAPEMPFVIGVMGVNGPTDQYGPSQQRYKAVHQSFRDAMAAPAALPEFLDNVGVVRTENYWDTEVGKLRERERSLRPQINEIEESFKAGQLNRGERQSAIDELYAQNFNERELTLLRTSTSNAEYHYMGSAGIMAQIGRAFATTMAEMQQ